MVGILSSKEKEKITILRVIEEKEMQEIYLSLRICNFCNVSGGGTLQITWNFRGSSMIPCWDIMNPKNQLALMNNKHMRGFQCRLYY